MIDSFRGDHAYLSNFHSCEVIYNGRRYFNSESAYQAQKFLGEDLRVQFEATTGSEAKKLARLSRAFTRQDWLRINLGFMAEIVHCKFTQNKDIREKLMLTYPQELIEGNTWMDRFWGVCNGTGLNWLGRILMAERAYWLDLTCVDRYKGDRMVPVFEAYKKEQTHAKATP